MIKNLNIAEKIGAGLLVLISMVGVWYAIRVQMLKSDLQVTPEMQSQADRVRILRDDYGVPHIFGKSDADTAFGLAYAHAEDDFAEIQMIIAATRGRLSLFKLNGAALGNDYYVGLIQLWDEVDANYEKKLSIETRALLEGYAAGLNYYVATHPGVGDARLFPVRGADLAAGFAHKLPLFMRMHKAVAALSSAENDWPVGHKLPALNSSGAQPLALLDHTSIQSDSFHLEGSNSHAVGPARSADGITRLNINSHQPWTGPVAWYEAHMQSEAGLNMNGATFPGAPLILVGHNDSLGWAHTVNKTDYIDVYKLKVKEVESQNENDSGLRYQLDGNWLALEQHQVPIKIDLYFFSFTVHKAAYRSKHGPVFKNDFGYFAIRYVGEGRFLQAVEQWYRMGKASNLQEWKAAMRMQALPMFNTVYADRQNIYYVYNALMPDRKAGLDWQSVMDGSRSDLIWQNYLPYDDLPQVENPPAGFVQNCNSSPFQTTLGAGNPDPARYKPEYGIEERMTNRALRSLELFGKDPSINHDEFLHYKWDRRYHPQAPIYKEAVLPVLQNFQPQNDKEMQALQILRDWDGSTEPHSQGASLAVLTWRPIWQAIVLEHISKAELPDPLKSFRTAVQWLEQEYGRVDVSLGQIQRMQRGNLDYGLGGGPDVLNAIHGKLIGDRLVGTAGDSYIGIVEFRSEGPRAWSLHQFGNSDVESSKHFQDQAPLFRARRLRRTYRTEAEIRALGAGKFREYRPGQN